MSWRRKECAFEEQARSEREKEIAEEVERRAEARTLLQREGLSFERRLAAHVAAKAAFTVRAADGTVLLTARWHGSMRAWIVRRRDSVLPDGTVVSCSGRADGLSAYGRTLEIRDPVTIEGRCIMAFAEGCTVEAGRCP